MYTIQELFDNLNDYILCETLDDVEIFRSVCEQEGYGFPEEAFNNIAEIAKGSIRHGFSYMIRADPFSRRKFNGLRESNRDSFRISNPGLRSNLYENCIKAKELGATNPDEGSFDLNLFNQMLGVASA